MDSMTFDAVVQHYRRIDALIESGDCRTALSQLALIDLAIRGKWLAGKAHLVMAVKEASTFRVKNYPSEEDRRLMMELLDMAYMNFMYCMDYDETADPEFLEFLKNNLSPAMTTVCYFINKYNVVNMMPDEQEMETDDIINSMNCMKV